MIKEGIFLLLTVCVFTTSAVGPKIEQERFLVASSISFTTFTLIKKTTTTTSILTTTSTCTTSTAALTTCTVGRRRRGLFYDQAGLKVRERRGLFYNEDEDGIKEETAFLPIETKGSEPAKVSVISVSEDQLIPLEIQTGFSVPDGSDSSRFLLAFGTSTITSLSISTTFVSLTAICSSTSGFPVCGGAGNAGK